ncbi:hypothetical protein TNCV_2210981 [Trichonephila clavipes]|nr:hypothetical protein TNCV_2210981 [Trichonephila clavipes]
MAGGPSDDVQELLDSHNQELTINELKEIHEQDNKHFLDNARSIAFSQCKGSTHLIEDATFNDSGIINYLIDYEDGHEEQDSLRADTMYAGV